MIGHMMELKIEPKIKFNIENIEIFIVFEDLVND